MRGATACIKNCEPV